MKNIRSKWPRGEGEMMTDDKVMCNVSNNDYLTKGQYENIISAIGNNKINLAVIININIKDITNRIITDTEKILGGNII